ncbi:MAG: hypothetical protein HY842_02775 [Bacteroidetes bacterium]|nr:hypothetical protein [Bacteroidota bacterium]
MKKLFFIAILASLALYFGCNKAEQEPVPVTPTETSDDITWNPNEDTNGAITTRSHCGALTECDCTVTTDADAELVVCGDIPTAMNTCPFTDCDDDPSFTANWDANTPKVFCVTLSGEVCIQNNSGSTVGVRVQFGTSTPISVNIAANDNHCWHTNTSCGTIDLCP